MVRLFTVRAGIEALKRIIAISGKLKPKTWVYLAIAQAVLAALYFWGYRDFPKYEAGQAGQSATQWSSDLEQTQQEKTALDNRMWEWIDDPTPPTVTRYSWNSTPRAGQPFSGTVTGTGFVVGGMRLYFCINSGTNSYEQSATNANPGTGPEATEKLWHSQQWLANAAQEQLGRYKRLFFSANGRTLVTGSVVDDAASKSLVRLFTTRKYNVTTEPDDRSALSHIHFKGFSTEEETALRGALLTKFTARCGEAFCSAGSGSPWLTLWGSGISNRPSIDLYTKQAEDLGSDLTKTRDRYQREFSTGRAQAGTVQIVVTNDEAINKYTLTYRFPSNHVARTQHALIATPYRGSASLSYHLAGKAINLSTSASEEAEAIMSVVPQGAQATVIGFEVSPTSPVERTSTHYTVVHFATHGLINSERRGLRATPLSIANRGGALRGEFLQLPFRQFRWFQPPAVLQVAGVQDKTLLDTLLKLMLLAQAIVLTVGSAIASAFAWVGYRRGRLDLKLKQLQVREAELRIENMERDRARAVQEATQSKIVLLS
jgi:hypothetical protein